MLSNKKNCFNEIRLLLATIVMFSHAYIISGEATLQQFSSFFDANFAIKSFFAISGYLVTISYLNSRSIKHYIGKRVRRIYPAYLFVIIYAFVIGLAVTEIEWKDFSTSAVTYKYLLSNLLFLNFIQHDLPGVFVNNNLTALNGSLWTIKVEVMLYATVPLILFCFNKCGQRLGVLILFISGALWFIFFSHYYDHPLSSVLARQFPGQLPYFVVGSFLAVYGLSQRCWHAVLVISAIYIVFPIPSLLAQYANMLMYPLFIIALARVAILNIGVGRVGDLSYGVYLFHFPTLQLITYSGLFVFNAWLALAVCVLITLLMAYISWHWIESKFLRRSH